MGTNLITSHGLEHLLQLYPELLNVIHEDASLNENETYVRNSHSKDEKKCNRWMQHQNLMIKYCLTNDIMIQILILKLNNIDIFQSVIWQVK